MATRALTVRAVASCRGHRSPGYAAQNVSLVAGVSASAALASTLLLLVSLAVAAVVFALATPWGHRVIARYKRRARYRRRELRLLEEGAPCDNLAALQGYVAERMSPSSRDPLAIDALLDRYAQVAVERQRCADGLLRTDRARLERRYVAIRDRRPLTAMLLERRIAQAAALEGQLIALDHSLGELAELICYSAERTGEPSFVWPVDDRRVTTILAELDAAG